MQILRVNALAAVLGTICIATMLGLHPAWASSKLPVRNMTVELRVISTSEAETPQRLITSSNAEAGYVVRTPEHTESGLQVQKLFVMNGEKANMRLGLKVPVQWAKSAAQQASAPSGTSGEVLTGASVQTETSWMDSGQGMSVTVRWPGGKQPAVVEVEIDTTTLQAELGQALPGQMRKQIATSIVTPLGEWATIAVTGQRQTPEQTGVYVTRTLESTPGKYVQVRVLAP